MDPGKIQTFDVLFIMILVNILSSAISFQQPPSSGPFGEREITPYMFVAADYVCQFPCTRSGVFKVDLRTSFCI